MMTPAGAFILYICCKRATRPRRNAPAKRAPWPSPSTPEGVRGLCVVQGIRNHVLQDDA